jgi:hypothetical protein
MQKLYSHYIHNIHFRKWMGRGKRKAKISPMEPNTSEPALTFHIHRIYISQKRTEIKYAWQTTSGKNHRRLICYRNIFRLSEIKNVNDQTENHNFHIMDEFLHGVTRITQKGLKEGWQL